MSDAPDPVVIQLRGLNLRPCPPDCAQCAIERWNRQWLSEISRAIDEAMLADQRDAHPTATQIRRAVL